MPPFLAVSIENNVFGLNCYSSSYLLQETTEPVVEIVSIDPIPENNEVEPASPVRQSHSEQENEHSNDQTTTTEDIPDKCICPGCENPSKEDEQWEGEFCCNECAIKYCQGIFKSWVQKQRNEQQV